MDKPYADVTVYEGDTITGYRLQCDPSKYIDSLARQLAAAVKTLEKIRDHEHCDENKVPNATTYDDLHKSYYARGHKVCSAMATEGLKEMERAE